MRRAAGRPCGVVDQDLDRPRANQGGEGVAQGVAARHIGGDAAVRLCRVHARQLITQCLEHVAPPREQADAGTARGQGDRAGAADAFGCAAHQRIAAFELRAIRRSPGR